MKGPAELPAGTFRFLGLRRLADAVRDLDPICAPLVLSPPPVAGPVATIRTSFGAVSRSDYAFPWPAFAWATVSRVDTASTGIPRRSAMSSRPSPSASNSNASS